MNAGHPVALDQMIDLLWGDQPPTSALNVLYRYVGALRRLLGASSTTGVSDQPLVRSNGGYLLDIDPDTVDLHHFRSLIEAARAPSIADDPARRTQLHLEALELWKGRPTGGAALDLRMHPLFVALDQEYLAVLQEAADVALTCGAAARILPMLRAGAARNPLDEPLQARLVLALAANGQQAEALEVWQQVRSRLVEELGVDPGPELRAAQQQVLGEPTDLVDSLPQTAQPIRPQQLPADLASFAGRRADLKRALALITDVESESAPKALVISAIGGLGGIGKTTLAVHWAHRVAHRFPDGQLYVNLRGFDPTGKVVDPIEALSGFLEALGVLPHQMPIGLEAHASLFRSLLVGRRLLVVLDNARDADQVRPLLPGASGCAVVITSRDRLSGLIAAEGAHPLLLDPLSASEARESLVRRLGEDGVAADPAAVEAIIARCGGLPLALAVVAARAAMRPDFPLSAIAAEISEIPSALDVFGDPDLAVDVRAVFSWSYRTLSSDAAQLFRWLSLHPGPDIDVSAVASLTGASPTRARELLTELTRASLLSECGPGRFDFHDLVRAYAAELTIVHDSASDREAAQHRILDHYLRTAHAACGQFSSFWRRPTPPSSSASVTPETFKDDRVALAWFITEHSVLVGVVELAVAEGFDTHVWQFAWTLERFFDRQGLWDEFAALMRCGLDAATRDTTTLDAAARDATTREVGLMAQAHLHRGLARASARLNDYEVADRHIHRSIKLFAEIGDKMGLAHAYRSHAWMLDRLGRFQESLAQAHRALDLYRACGLKPGATSILHAMGGTHLQLGEFHQAARYFSEAQSQLEPRGDRYGHAGVWDGLGLALHHLGDHQRAISCYENALELYRDVGDGFNEACTLNHVGDTYSASGNLTAARSQWQRALDLLGSAGPLTVKGIRAKLQRPSMAAKGTP